MDVNKKEIKLTVEYSCAHSVDYYLRIPKDYKVDSVVIDVNDVVRVYNDINSLMDQKDYKEICASYRNVSVGLEDIIENWITARFSSSNTSWWSPPSNNCNCDSRDLLFYGCRCRTKIDWESRCYRNVIK